MEDEKVATFQKKNQFFQWKENDRNSFKSGDTDLRDCLFACVCNKITACLFGYLDVREAYVCLKASENDAVIICPCIYQVKHKSQGSIHSKNTHQTQRCTPSDSAPYPIIPVSSPLFRCPHDSSPPPPPPSTSSLRPVPTFSSSLFSFSFQFAVQFYVKSQNIYCH